MMFAFYLIMNALVIDKFMQIGKKLLQTILVINILRFWIIYSIHIACAYIRKTKCGHIAI